MCQYQQQVPPRRLTHAPLQQKLKDVEFDNTVLLNYAIIVEKYSAV